MEEIYLKKFKAFFVLITILSVILVGCSNSDFQADHHYEVKDFTYTNQDNEKVSLNDLKGKVWIADFVFTKCETVCPPMTYNLTQLQEKLKEEGVKDYQFVSFSVDPETDKPEVLKEFIGGYEADESKWDLLTGYKLDEIADLAEHSFKTIVADDPKSDQMIHGTSFYLVNQKGEVVKSYSGNSDVPFDLIVEDMKTLIKEGNK
jgi:protein SCO1